MQYAEKLESTIKEKKAKGEDVFRVKKSTNREAPAAAAPPSTSTSTSGEGSSIVGEKPPGTSSLDDIVNLELFQQLDSEDIQKMWREYHASKDVICAVVPATTYDIIRSRSSECPLFIYPVPRDDGYEFFVSQFRGHQCGFVSLGEYKQRQEYAQPCMIMTFYPELVESKDIVLMRGEVNTDLSDVQVISIYAKPPPDLYSSII